MTREPELEREARLWMMGSAASIFVCGSCLGIAGTLLCYLAMEDARRGDIASSTARLVWGKRVTLAGAFIGFITLGVAFITRALS